MTTTKTVHEHRGPRFNILNPIEILTHHTLSIPTQSSDVTSRRIPFLEITDSSIVEVKLVEELQTVVGKHSQVWKAELIDYPHTVVVLKIVQPSLCYHPHPDDSWLGVYTDPEDAACSEAWAYENLKEQQGLCIPYFFGLQTITTPSGESAWVLFTGFGLQNPTDHVTDRQKFIRANDPADPLRASRRQYQAQKP
ncbi:hypothetical protein B0H19DRAFT_1247947 [Mycena capillaripes]|nr:hypothetical protein B0H19DRAFT_1247947 [Mycena capillaripes]